MHGTKRGLVLRSCDVSLGARHLALIHVVLAPLPPQLKAPHVGVQQGVPEVAKHEGRVG